MWYTENFVKVKVPIKDLNDPKIAKVFFKDTYRGRIVKNEEGLYEYHEIGHGSLPAMFDVKEHTTFDEAVEEAKVRLCIQHASRFDNLPPLSKTGLEFLSRFADGPVLRKLMSSDEIRVANFFVKQGLLEKGRSDDSYASVIYYVDVVVARKLGI